MEPRRASSGVSHRETVEKEASRPVAGPSRSKPLSSKKRGAATLTNGHDTDLGVNGDGLELDGDDASTDGNIDEDADEEDLDEEPFPELDSGSEDVEDEDEEDQAGPSRLIRRNGGPHAEVNGEETGDQTSEDEAVDDEESGSESGYNTSDIEALYSSSTSVSASPTSSSKRLEPEEQLDRLIRKNTVKPDESIGVEGKLSKAKDGTGKLRPSKFVTGGFTREYDEVEAGYGSESSTEDVSLFCLQAMEHVANDHPEEPQHSRQHPYGMVRRPPSHRVRRIWSKDLPTSSRRRAG